MPVASWNLTINIIHKQYLDNYLISITYDNRPRFRGWNVTYLVHYMCLSRPSKYCPKNWVTLAPCSVHQTKSRVTYSCFLEKKRILFFNEYTVRASARLPCGWVNATSSFIVDTPGEFVYYVRACLNNLQFEGRN